MLAIVYCVNYFRPYLYGRKFKFVTDHRPLVWLNLVKDPTSRLARWRIKLAEYNYEIIYKKGKINSNADALSQNPIKVMPFTAGFPSNKPQCSTSHHELPPAESISPLSIIEVAQDIEYQGYGYLERHFEELELGIEYLEQDFENIRRYYRNNQIPPQEREIENMEQEYEKLSQDFAEFERNFGEIEQNLEDEQFRIQIEEMPDLPDDDDDSTPEEQPLLPQNLENDDYPTETASETNRYLKFVEIKDQLYMQHNT